MKKRTIIKLAFHLFLFFIVSCQKSVDTEGGVLTVSDTFFNEDSDELFCDSCNDEDSDNEIEDKNELGVRSSPFKILKIWTNDSLPAINPITNKTQKYGKRQIVSTVKKTRFYIDGYGFKPRNDSSYIKAIITKIEQNPVDIISWSDSAIVVDFPILTHAAALYKTFSISFRVYRSNDNPLKKDVYKSKSRTCISDLQVQGLTSGSVKSPLSPECATSTGFAKKFRVDSMSLPNATINGFVPLSIENYEPIRGEILYSQSSGKEYLITEVTTSGIKARLFKYTTGATCPVSLTTPIETFTSKIVNDPVFTENTRYYYESASTPKILIDNLASDKILKNYFNDTDIYTRLNKIVQNIRQTEFSKNANWYETTAFNPYLTSPIPGDVLTTNGLNGYHRLIAKTQILNNRLDVIHVYYDASEMKFKRANTYALKADFQQTTTFEIPAFNDIFYQIYKSN